MNTQSRDVGASNPQPRTEVETPRNHAVAPATTGKVNSHAAGAGNPGPQAAQPQYHAANTQYRAADRLVQRVGPSADAWFATRSGGVDLWLTHAGAHFDWPRINTFASETAIGAIAVGAKAEGRDTTAASADRPGARKPGIRHTGGVATHATSAGRAGSAGGSAGSTASFAGPASARAAGTAAVAAPPPTQAAPKRLAAKHAPPVRELSDSRLMLQIGLLLALVYLAFVICWLAARRSRPRMLRRGLRA